MLVIIGGLMEANMQSRVADDLPTGVRTAPGTMEEMVANFNGWDPTQVNYILG